MQFLRDLLSKKEEEPSSSGGSRSRSRDEGSADSSGSGAGLLARASEALGVVPRVVSSSRRAGLEVVDDESDHLAANKHAMELQAIKQAWMQEQMRKKVTEYGEESQLKVFCGTWNVAASVLDDSVDVHGLSGWLNAPDAGPVADVYAIAFQEIVDLNAVNVVISDKENAERVPYWRSKIEITLNEIPSSDGYVARSITDIALSSIAMGIMGMMGNKGGVSIRFKYNLTSFCFIAAHFYPDREGVQMRNANFFTIFENSVFERHSNQYNKSTLSTEGVLYNLGSGPMKFTDASILEHNIKIGSHDVIFWLGDLNYRINVSVPTEVVLAKCTENAWASLIVVDQLNEERISRAVFEGFEEGEINFPPTYKFEPRSDRYESRHGKKLRAPAWCDRVLWRPNKYCPDSVLLERYNCCSTLLMSDHRPVYATFQIKVHKATQEKERSTYQDLLRFLDKWENATAPRVEIPTRSINYGIVNFQQLTSKSLLIRNTGGSIARWVIVTKHSDSSICKPYLKVTPASGILSPGEESIIHISALINEVNVLELQNSLLDDVIVLRVINGADAFIVVSGELNLASVREYEAASRRPTSIMRQGSSTAYDMRGAALDDAMAVEVDLGDIYGQGDSEEVTSYGREDT